jgi:hypothetical protein
LPIEDCRLPIANTLPIDHIGPRFRPMADFPTDSGHLYSANAFITVSSIGKLLSFPIFSNPHFSSNRRSAILNRQSQVMVL